MNRHVHIVTHDVPYPADFGGMIDPMCMIEALSKSGVEVTLHTYYSKRSRAPELEMFCKRVHYYKRKTGITAVHGQLPYIVSSRNARALVKNLAGDTDPVILQGLHVTLPYFRGALGNRKVFLRMFNVEHVYYRHLARAEKNLARKIFFSREAKFLKGYESMLAPHIACMALSTTDAAHYDHWKKEDKCVFLPAFLPWQEINVKTGFGSYCLYHGNLGVNENESAAIFLLDVFSKIEIPFVIAGRNPSKKLRDKINAVKNVRLVSNPSGMTLQELIEDAQVNVLPSMNKTGVKLKLLNALFNGRHCIVNNAGVDGSGLESLTQIADSADEFAKKIFDLFDDKMTDAAISQRAAVLRDIYSNEKNLAQLSSWLW